MELTIINNKLGLIKTKLKSSKSKRQTDFLMDEIDGLLAKKEKLENDRSPTHESQLP